MQNAENVFHQINSSVSGVEDVHKSIDEAVENCSNKVDRIQNSMYEHESQYTKVQMNIDELKGIMTEKGFIYEDISNMMEQAEPLLKEIADNL